MYAVINKETREVLRQCQTLETAIIAASLEKDKVSAQERNRISAVALDDEGYVDIRL